MDELSIRVHANGYHIVAITESWATNDMTDAELSIAGYTLHRKDRVSDTKCKGGGVLLYVKEPIVHTPVEQLNVHEIEESVWCELELNVGKLLPDVCYRSTASDPENNDLLRQASLIAERSHLLIMGDFNYPEINYEDYEVKAACTSDAAKFFDQTRDLFLHQHVNCLLYTSDAADE